MPIKILIILFFIAFYGPMSTFHHLHLHSHYSLLEGIGSPQGYIAAAQAQGAEAIALTDYNGLYGAIEFYQAAQKASIKPLLGVELFCVHDALNPDDQAGGYIILLAKNNEGYHDLLKLVSFANMDGFSMKPRIDFTRLTQYGKNLLCLVGAERSIIGQMIINNEPAQKQAEVLTLLKNATDSASVYCMLSTYSEATFPQVKRINNALTSLAETTNTPIALTNDVHYINADDQQPYEVALAIKDGKRIYDNDRRKATQPAHFASYQEIITTMLNNGYTQETLDRYLANNQSIVETIDCTLSLNQLLFPRYSSPEEIQALYEENKEMLIEK